MRTLPGIAWRHANISNPSGFHDVMEGMHLTRSKWIRGVLWMYAPTVSSIGVLGSNRWPIYMDVSLVWGQQNRNYIVRRRYNPTATFRDFSWQNQRCASYSSHVDWHIPVDLGLLRYPHFDVDRVQQERKPWSWRQFHLWEALALWSLCQGWPQKDHWSMSIKYVRRTGIFGSYTYVCSIKRVDTSIISVDYRGNQISKSIDGWRRTQLWYAWKTLLHPRPIPANLGFHMTCNRVWFSKSSSPSCPSGLNKIIFCLGNESNLWKGFTVGHFLGRVCHGGPSKMVSWVRQSYLWQIEFVFVLTRSILSSLLFWPLFHDWVDWHKAKGLITNFVNKYVRTSVGNWWTRFSSGPLAQLEPSTNSEWCWYCVEVSPLCSLPPTVYVVQLSHIDLDSKLFEGYKEDSMEFLDWLYYYLYNYTICSHLY